MRCKFVLVVDDDDDVRESIEDVLTLDGYEVVGVANGEQAVGALAVATPRAVVTDLEMPIRDGQSLIEHLRGDRRTRQVPVCVVSANHAAAPKGACFVPKPFELSELRDAIRRLLHCDG